MNFRAHSTELDGRVRVETHQGRDYLVAPLVLIREGVLNEEFVSHEAIAHSSPGWNGVPVTVNHPTDEDGNFVSANSPEFIENQGLGRIYNSAFAEDISGQRGEMWVDVQRALDLGEGAEKVVETLASHALDQRGEELADDGSANDESPEMLEVSTGYWHGRTGESGTYNEERYTDAHSDLLPDHLAALPDSTGACSVEDGCGAPRVNQLMSANEGDDVGVLAAVRSLFSRNQDEDEGSDGEGGEGNESNPGDSAQNSADDGGNGACGCDKDPTMGHDFKKLASNSDFTAEQLREMHENQHEQFEALESSIETLLDSANDGDGDDSGDGGDGGGDGGDGDGDGDADGTANQSLSEEKVAEIVVNTMDKREQKKERAAHVETITSNTSKEAGDLEDKSDEELASMAELVSDVSPASNGVGVNYGGRATGDLSSNEDEGDEYEIPLTALSSMEDDD